MTPQEIAASGLLPGTPVKVTRMVSIGEPLIVWAGALLGLRGRGYGLTPEFSPRDIILMHPVDWWQVFTGRDVWAAVEREALSTFDEKWERAGWREIGADR